MYSILRREMTNMRKNIDRSVAVALRRRRNSHCSTVHGYVPKSGGVEGLFPDDMRCRWPDVVGEIHVCDVTQAMAVGNSIGQ